MGVDDHGVDHVTAIGRRRFVALGALAGAGIALAPFDVVEASVPRGATRFIPLERQERLADTREPGSAHRTVGPNRIRVQVAGRAGVPPTATAALLTATAVCRERDAFVAVFPSGGSIPVVSNLNLAGPGNASANLVGVTLRDGAVDMYANEPVDMILDVAGSFLPVSGPVAEGRFVPLPTAVRVIDTRNGRGRPVGAGGTLDVDVSAAGPGVATATSVVVNVTAVETRGPGFFTCFPFGAARPEASNLNVNGPGEIRAGAAAVRLGRSGGRPGFRVYSHGGAHVVVDVAGYYTGPGAPSSTDGLFVPMSPVRVLDTRSGLGGTRGRLWPGWTVDARPPEPATRLASAIAANVTAVDARGPGFFTAFASGTPRREVSNLNTFAAGQIVPNHAAIPVSTRGVAVYAHSGAHVLVDVFGWYTGTPQSTSMTHRNPLPPVAVPPWTLEIPALWNRARSRRGYVSAVFGGAAADPIVDAGHTWHWQGTGMLGQASHIGLFGHRTEARSPWYRVNELRAGDEIILHVGRPEDRRRFRYRVVRQDMVLNVRYPTASNVARILEATRRAPGPTVSLITCSNADGSPSSLSHRLVVTAQLVDVTEDGVTVPRP